MKAASPDHQPRVALRGHAPEFPRVESVLRTEEQRYGRPRQMTQAVADSPATWRATTSALHLYATLRKLAPALVDLLCLYTSLLNGCHYCIDDAAGEALQHGWPAASLLALGADRGEAFPPATTAALDFARAVAHDPAGVTDEQVARLQDHFGNEAVLEIALVVSMKNFWNRFATSLRIPPEGKCSDPELFAALD